MKILRRLMLVGSFALFVMLGAVPAEVAANGAIKQRGSFTFSTTSPCLPFPDVGFVVCGVAGTVDYHLVFTPSGTLENSWFKVQDFTGAVFRCNNLNCSSYGPIFLIGFNGDSAMVQVHLGPNRADFILLNHPTLSAPHRIPLE